MKVTTDSVVYGGNAAITHVQQENRQPIFYLPPITKMTLQVDANVCKQTLV
jgi:hypothetical protein